MSIAFFFNNKIFDEAWSITLVSEIWKIVLDKLKIKKTYKFIGQIMNKLVSLSPLLLFFFLPLVTMIISARDVVKQSFSSTNYSRSLWIVVQPWKGTAGIESKSWAFDCSYTAPHIIFYWQFKKSHNLNTIFIFIRRPYCQTIHISRDKNIFIYDLVWYPDLQMLNMHSATQFMVISFQCLSNIIIFLHFYLWS